ncbi:helix-turn-helix domain-containing protein [Virgibacillus kimchii]
MEFIGQKLQQFREKKGVSRRKMVDGICDESTLFRIEKGETSPNIFILNELCKKLKIPLSALFDNETIKQKQSITRIKQNCRKHVYHKDYINLEMEIENLSNLVEKVDEDNDHLLFINWHKAILLHKKDNKPLLAKELLLNELPEHLESETAISTMNVLGLICASLNEDKEALTYFQQAFQAVKNILHLEDETLYVRICYNLASRYYYKENYSQVIQLSKELLAYLKNNSLFYLKGRTYHMLAKSFQRTGEYKLAEENMKIAISIFFIKEKEEYLTKAKKDLEDIRMASV